MKEYEVINICKVTSVWKVKAKSFEDAADRVEEFGEPEDAKETECLILSTTVGGIEIY